MEGLRKTPFYDCHVEHGGKIVDFGGWALPVQFTGILQEHRTVRQKAGLFDVSHMGEIIVEGPDALAYLQRLVSNDVSRLSDGQIQYTHMLYPNGGTVDDLMVYRRGPDRYMLIVNAANADKDYAWATEHAEGFDVEVRNESDDTAELALQGPESAVILQKLADCDLGDIRYYWFRDGVDVGGIRCTVSRTGYTGEDGFEIYCSPKDATALWKKIMEAGEDRGIRPAGLGARDSLRFEAGMPLYGQELDAETSPLEAGLARFVALDKEGFIGREALLERARSLPKRLVGFKMVDRGIPRTHYPVYRGDEKVGEVTSGTFSPTLGENLGMGYVPPDMARVGGEIEVEIRGKRLKARIVKLPFYRRPR